MFLARKDLVHAKGRFALIAGVVVAITVLVGLLGGLTAGLGQQSTSAVTGLSTDRLVFSGKEPSFDTSAISLSRQPVDGEALGFATMRATPVEAGEQPASDTADQGGAAVTMIGTEPGSSVTPQARGIGEQKVVLTTAAADALKVGVDDRIRLGATRFTVAAVRGDASFAHTPVVWTTLGDWQQVSGNPGTATVIATDSTTAPDGYTSLTVQEAKQAISSYTAENRSLTMIQVFLYVISALVLGAFFTVWTIQRTPDIAVLKALGASTGYLLRDALAQAALLLGLGIALGLAVVLAAGSVVGDAVPFSLTPVGLATPAAAMFVLGILGAGLAVRRVTSVDPLTALGSAR